MANCVISAGIGLECLESTGGIKNVFIGAYSETPVWTVTSGVITGVVNPATFYKFKFRPQTATFDEEGTHSVENGTNFYTQNINLSFHKKDTTKRNNIMALAGTSMHVIVQTQNDDYWLCGMQNGVLMTASSSKSGQGFGDFSGLTMGLVGTEPRMATELDSTTIGLITFND